MKAEFAGKTALVTGASRGIGAATALSLAREGAARVVLHYNGYREGAEQTAAPLKRPGAKPTFWKAIFPPMQVSSRFLAS
jgi:Dehydrogenases with different specificities (related to short-chain alcohol dehydrogenases)